MLRTGFIGNENFFDRFVCEWLAERTDLKIILWTNRLAWAGSRGPGRGRRVLGRFVSRARRRGTLRALDEALYYALYRGFVQKKEVAKLKRLIGDRTGSPRRPISEIEQVEIADIRSPDLARRLEDLGLDALFAMCVDVYLPRNLIGIPRYGAFLWHEGITPEYRGVYSPFWALARKDYGRLGYTLLKMNEKLDAGEVYVQGRAKDIDPHRDWHSFIGHKAILDSLPEVESFLRDLERGKQAPLERAGAEDGYYSYPTASAFARILWHRMRNGAR